MLLEIAIGDAYGAGFEYSNPTTDRVNNATRYVQNLSHPDLRPGCYTDDTQMSVAVAEVLTMFENPSKADFTEAFHMVFARDPRKGYSRNFQALLEEVKSGEELGKRLKPDSEKSGGAMRACPVGILPTVESVKAMAALQASVTHNTPRGIAAAQGAALMTHYTLWNLGPRKDLPEFLAAHEPVGAWTTPFKGKVGSLGLDSTRAALSAYLNSRSLTEVLINSVAFTGDVDTVAAIAMGVASINTLDIEWDIPQTLVDELEGGKYGKEYLDQLDQQLFAWFRKLTG